MMSGHLLKESVRGFSHLRKEIPCEDYALLSEENGVQIFAVADGHGDSSCPRSRLGSQFACEAAVRFLQQLADASGKSEKSVPTEEKEPIWKIQEKQLPDLFQAISQNWKQCVRTHYSEHPLTEAEKEGCSERYRALYEQGKQLEHLYGTTLIAGMCRGDQLLLIHQGDGRCIVFDEKACASQPVPWDENCIGNITTSMCDSNAASEMRFFLWDLQKHPVTAVFLATDGVEDSYPSEEAMYNFYRTLLLYAEDHGLEEMQDSLSETLTYLSRKGSGDDISIAGMVNTEKLTENRERLKHQSDLVKLQTKETSLRDHLGSMRAKLLYLEERAEEAQKDYESVRSPDEEVRPAVSEEPEIPDPLEETSEAIPLENPEENSSSPEGHGWVHFMTDRVKKLFHLNRSEKIREEAEQLPECPTVDSDTADFIDQSDETGALDAPKNPVEETEPSDTADRMAKEEKMRKARAEYEEYLGTYQQYEAQLKELLSRKGELETWLK